MPGIHVRSLGRLDWENHDKDPALTVPGSYWLCHKSNIYKFTFKFHKNIRNSTNFTYSKELMKIIRRVIKWQPRQGQHFSTKNLLVTYNHASWTRQDKMFAVMKFCDRPDAIAFPHAFILTVKDVNLETESQQNEQTMGSLTTKPDSQSPPEIVSGSDNATPPEGVAVENSPKKVGEVNRVDSTLETCVGVRSANGLDSEEINGSWSPRTRSRLKKSGDQAPSNSMERESNVSQEFGKMTNKREKIDKVDISSKSSVIKNGIKAERDMDCNGQDEPLVKPKMPMASTQGLDSGKSFVDDNEDSNSSNDSQSDSASLPYQYLIEKDIERELHNTRNTSKSNSSKENDSTSANVAEPVNNCDSSLDSVSKCSKDSRKSNSKLRLRQDSKDSDSAPMDVANLRSSDITDLVMKGLMFTIRQDKDTVTVVEQKTKLEVDEVLENSEKVETKEGDPCLLNSSLLRLEKMITRMQEPPVSLPEQSHNGASCNKLDSFITLTESVNVEIEKKLNEANIDEKKEACQSTASLETANCWSQFFPDKDISDSTFQKIEKALGDSSMYLNDEDGIDDMELKIDDDEEEDIIPEALVHHSFLDGDLDAISKTPSTMNAFEDLLMDDLEPNDEVIVDEISTKLPTVSRPASSLSINEDSLDKKSSKISKVKVISNEIITNDQIPPALLKALKSKKSQSNSIKSSSDDSSKDSFKSNDEINIKNIEPAIEISTKPIITENNNIRTDIKVKEINKDARIEVSLEKLKDINVKNHRNDDVSNTESNLGRALSPSSPVDTSVDKKCHKYTSLKNSDTSKSNSISVDNVRVTRSNSKLIAKSNEASKSSITNNSNILKSECSVETRAQRILDRNSNKQLNEILVNKSVSRKRKRSMDEHCASKFSKTINNNKTEKKEVTIKVWKLINDITYGVKVVVERLDIKNIKR